MSTKNIEEQIKQQGDLVRKLKAAKESKEKVRRNGILIIQCNSNTL